MSLPKLLQQAIKSYCQPSRQNPINSLPLDPIQEERSSRVSDESSSSSPAPQQPIYSTITVLLELAYVEVAQAVERDILPPFKAHTADPLAFEEIESPGTAWTEVMRRASRGVVGLGWSVMEKAEVPVVA